MREPLPFATTLGPAGSRHDLTGSWRTERPVYVHLTPPCQDGCPAGEDVRGWLGDAALGPDGYEQAWRRLMEANPFPATMGRICYHPCQDACNRGQVDEAVGINSVERFLGDEAIRAGWAVPAAAPSGYRVLVVGAGPAGLSAAYHLARRGHAVEVRDAGGRPGGMMRYGIPAYRLPTEVLDAEIARIVALGVRIESGSPVTDLRGALDDGGFDAAFVAVGAQLGIRTEVPAGTAARMLDAVSVLHHIADGDPPLLGRRVAVYGGGNTAIDAARSARRLGATDVVVIYRRTRDRMPAHDTEVAEAEDEGVAFRWLSTVEHLDADEVVLERMELDETGFPRPTGELETLRADSLVLALGQESDLSLVEGVDPITVTEGRIVVDGSQMTGLAGVFAGGDVVPGPRSATAAIGQGRRAADAIDAHLHGRVAAPGSAAPVVGVAQLNTWYFEDAPRSHRERLEAARRSSTFSEVVSGLDADTAQYEARRCMSCGSCFSCDNCFAMCPDNAIVKTGDPDAPYAIDLDYCKGCGLCAPECPAGAIDLVPEQI